MRIEMLAISDVVVGDRHRKNIGDLSDLTESIKTHGLLQPIGITAERKLIFGHRRLEASKLAECDEIEARVFEHLDDAVEALQLERDENTCRKDFTRSEAVALGRELEKLERERAEKRQLASRAKPGEQIGAQGGVESAPPDRGKTREKVAKAIGMAGSTYTEAKAVVDAAESDPEQFGYLVEKMDETGNVHGAYRELKRARDDGSEPKKKPFAKRIEEIKALATGGNNAAQIAEAIGISRENVMVLAKRGGVELPDAKIGGVHKINAHRVIETTVHGLAGYAQGLQMINGSVREIDADLAAEWADSLKGSLSSIQRLRKQLLEVANGHQRKAS